MTYVINLVLGTILLVSSLFTNAPLGIFIGASLMAFNFLVLMDKL